MELPDADLAFLCWTLLAIALGLVIASITMLVDASHHERGHLVDIYDARVVEWERSREHFADAAFTVDLKLEGATDTSNIKLKSNESVETIPDHGLDLLPYEPLRYDLQHLPLGEDSSDSAGEWSERSFSLTLRSSVPSSGSSCESKLGGVDGFSLGYRAERFHQGSQKSCASHFGGTYVASQGACVTYYALSEICVKVSLHGGCWRPDPSGGGDGCEPGDQNAWAVGVYRRVPGHRPAGGPAFNRDPPQQVVRPTVLVRHVADPVVVAQNLTAGSLNFGTQDYVKGIGALELLLCAVALGSPTIMFFMRRFYGRDCCGAEALRADSVRFTRVPVGEAEMMRVSRTQDSAQPIRA
jgi:hypothetical protein